MQEQWGGAAAEIEACVSPCFIYDEATTCCERAGWCLCLPNLRPEEVAMGGG